jgi:nucleotide-binding universal stress UspA family protein
MKILIGYDGSEHAEAAIADLDRAGLPQAAEAFVAAVSESLLPVPLSFGGVETSYADPAVTGESGAYEIAKAGARKVSEMFPSWHVDHGAAVGSPESVMLSKAEEWKPDLIVIGSQSRGAIGRFFLGSAAQSLVTNAPCSVRVGRRTKDRMSSELRLVAAVDGSKHSSAAVSTIVGRYRYEDCRVRLISVTELGNYQSIKSFDLVEPTPQVDRAAHQAEIKRAEDAALNAVAKLTDAGFSVSSVVENGDPRDVILRQAEEWDADCVFVGARGLNRIERMLLGSVSSYVAARANCSVEVVRSSAS